MNCSTDAVYFNQAYSRWKDIVSSETGTIGRDGCGLTSLSVIVSTLTDNIIDSVEMCQSGYIKWILC